MSAPALPPLRAAALIAAVALSGGIGGAITGRAAAARAQEPFRGLERFALVLGRIERSYVEPVDEDRLVRAAIRGMTAELDPHTAWYASDEAAGDDTREGIGAVVAATPDGLRIERVLPNSPASLAGLAPGDVIVRADGRALAGAGTSALDGPVGTPIALEVRRAGAAAAEPLVTLRDRVWDDPASAFVARGVVVARLRDFHHGAADALKRAIEAASPAPAAIVLDLRDDPGGVLTEAVAVADLFLDDGPIVSTRDRAGAERVFTATPGGWTAPLVVLVDGRSASASEVVAAAIQDRGRGRLFGTRTYGKGSVQSYFGYDDGSQLKLTTGRYYTPSGAPVAPREGRTPDVVIDLPAPPGPKEALRAKIAASTLPAADKASWTALVDQLDGPTPPPAPIPWTLTGEARLAADPPLRAAIEHLK